MSKYLFRGQDDKGKWHYGMPVNDFMIDDCWMEDAYINNGVIVCNGERINKETIGMLSPFKDIEEQRIFAGDLIQSTIFPDSDKSPIREVVFKNGAFRVNGGSLEKLGKAYLDQDYIDVLRPIIVGNSTDNPELLEGKK